MTKLPSSLFALAGFAAFALLAQAQQPALKICVVDIGKVYDAHYEKQEKEAELRTDQEKAEEQIENLNKEGRALVDQYKQLLDQSKNPALTPEAQAKASDDAKKKLDDINSKQNEVNTFKTNVERELQQRIQNIRSVLIDEISRTATDVAKRHGATLLFDKSGASIYGANVLLYSDPAYDITDEVIKEVNKDRPPPTTPAAGSTTAPSTAPSDDETKVVVPGLTPSKQ